MKQAWPIFRDIAVAVLALWGLLALFIWAAG